MKTKVAPAAATPTTTIPAPVHQNLKLSVIIVKPQTRTVFEEDALKELTESIRTKGVLQAIAVNLIGGERHLIFGERRYRAMLAINSEDSTRDIIPAAIYNDLSDEQVLDLQITENLHRKDISPMEEAVSFKRYVDNNNLTPEELAKRVGKSVVYVYQRLRLNDLAEPFQKALFQERINLTTAFELCKLAGSDQIHLWEDNFSTAEGKLDVERYMINRYMNNLLSAPFDTQDHQLIPKMGACDSCPFNSAYNTLLFPDQATKSVCTKGPCYREKAQLSYNNSLIKAMDSPDVILISNKGNALGEDGQVLVENGHEVIKCNDWQAVHKPDMPELSNFDDEEYESEEEKLEAFNAEMADYQKDVATLEEKVLKGKLLKAFVVEGHGTGEYKYISIKKSEPGKVTVQDIKEKMKSDTATDAEIKAAIKKMEEKEARNKELDEEKIQPLIYELVNKNKEVKTSTKKLAKVEKVGQVLMLVEYGGYNTDNAMNKFLKVGERDSGRVKMFHILMGLTDARLEEALALATRNAYVCKMRVSIGQQPGNNALAASIKEIATLYHPKEVETLWNGVLEARAKREVRLKERTGEFKAKLKSQSSKPKK